MTETVPKTDRAVIESTAYSVILAVSFCHLLNDMMQSLFPAIYPILQAKYHLDFSQIGLLTLTFQITASILQPIIGMATDRRPLPYSTAIGMGFTLVGLLLLSVADRYGFLLVAAAFVGLGSAVFHPESSRVARLASGGRHGLAQSLFQVGGNVGSSIGPLLAAFIVLPRGQGSLAGFSLFALLGMIVLWQVGNWYSRHRAAAARRPAVSRAVPLPQRTVVTALIVLALLVFTKYIYMASLTNYYTFYLIHKFGVSVRDSQLLLFLFLGGMALGTVAGGPIGDRFGSKNVIWFSILGILPFTLALPYANLHWTAALTVLIGITMASAFPAIVVLAQELVPGKVGMIAGLFFGFAFGMAGIAAALLGALADLKGIDYVYRLCSFLPLLGLLTVFLPGIHDLRATAPVPVPAEAPQQ
jgi:FSR family fosmidomycin resistance protein-like MFS transporter